MDTITKLFDFYELKARVLPGIIVLAPLIISIYLWYPGLLTLNFLGINLLVLVALIFLLAKLSRNRGIKIQRQLLLKWGGFPTNKFLRLSNKKIDKVTKARYHYYLRREIWNIDLPSSTEEEQENIDYYKEQYSSCVKWLKEKTRDQSQYPLIFKDNVNYGFSRNLLGLKPIGITISIIALILNIIGLFLSYDNFNIPFQIFVSTGLSLTFIFIWFFMISEKLVENNADAYALSLLAACENTNNTKGE